MRGKMIGGGGGTIDTDTLTASTDDVRDGKVFYGAGTDEEQTGSLPDMENAGSSPGFSSNNPVPLHPSSDTEITQDTLGNTRIALCPPKGIYPGEQRAYVGCFPDDLGVTAEKIRNGYKVAGITGNYGNDATIKESDIRAGKVGYGLDGRIVGSANDYGAVNKTLKAGESYTINPGMYSNGKVTAADLASQTGGNAGASDIISGKIAWVNGGKVAGNIADQAGYTNAVSLGDNGSNLYARIPYGAYRVKSGGASYPEIVMAHGSVAAAIGLTSGKMIKGQSACGISGTAWRSTAISYTIYNGNINFTGYSNTAGNRTIDCGTPYSDWDTIIMQIRPNTTYCGPITIALSKGHEMRAPVTVEKNSDSVYYNCWLSITRGWDGRIKISPFRGNRSGTYSVTITAFMVCDGINNTEA